MIGTLLIEKDERGARHAPPHLSYSRISCCLHCPEQYRLYVEKLRPRYLASALVFGQVMHASLAQFFLEHGTPDTFFRKAWEEVRQIDLVYSKKES
jgi:hypothetical protein